MGVAGRVGAGRRWCEPWLVSGLAVAALGVGRPLAQSVW
jgi:hypothetical protein